MGGLGAGSWWLGRKADQAAHPLAFYGRLELAVAASAAVTPLLVFVVRQGYIALGGTLTLGLVAGTLVRLLFSAVVLCVPTVLMGGTLPAATRSVETEEDPARRSLALLYGSNTLGAVTGAALSTFLLLETFGTRMTLWLACAVNALVGLAAVRLSRRAPPVPVEADGSRVQVPGSREPEPDRQEKKKKHKPKEEAAAPSSAPAVASPSHSRGFVLASAAIVGFAFFLMELVWYRMLAPLLGGSSYTFGLILAVALAGIGAGSAVYWLAAGESRATLSRLRRDLRARGAVPRRPLCARGPARGACGSAPPDRRLRIRRLRRGVVARRGDRGLPRGLRRGLQFPLLIALLGRGRERVGADVGSAYAWNTMGGIAGSLAGGFGLCPLLSATGPGSSSPVCCARSLSSRSSSPSPGGGRPGREASGWRRGLQSARPPRASSCWAQPAPPPRGGTARSAPGAWTWARPRPTRCATGCASAGACSRGRRTASRSAWRS